MNKLIEMKWNNLKIHNSLTAHPTNFKPVLKDSSENLGSNPCNLLTQKPFGWKVTMIFINFGIKFNAEAASHVLG